MLSTHLALALQICTSVERRTRSCDCSSTRRGDQLSISRRHFRYYAAGATPALKMWWLGLSVDSTAKRVKTMP